MVSKITEGIEISVETFYQQQYSNEANGEYMFAYRITIENHNLYTVQLLRRHWTIFDSNAQIRDVDGDGVVGLQPIIQSGDKFTYSSCCNLNSELGKMKGNYTMKNLHTLTEFVVNIPAFSLIAPCKLN